RVGNPGRRSFLALPWAIIGSSLRDFIWLAPQAQCFRGNLSNNEPCYGVDPGLTLCMGLCQFPCPCNRLRKARSVRNLAALTERMKRLFGFLLACCMAELAGAAVFKISAFNRTGGLAWTNAFAYGICTLEMGSTPLGPWLPEQSYFTTS